MKKILISVGIIGVVAAAIIGGTVAYFSDTETSTGNVFTAGAIDLKIDNTSYVTDNSGRLVLSTETSWTLNDLTEELFFNFSDLKPGDIGEDTISLHVNDNDAWACMNIAITGTPENGQTEPELKADNSLGLDEGELQDELYFAFWADDGDNVYEVEEEIFEQGIAGEIFDGTNVALADSETNVWNGEGPLMGGGDNVYYVGKAWCYGTLSENPVAQGENTSPLVRGTGFDCDGAPVSNASQTDGITADVTFYAEQSRNNDDFVCGQPRPEEKVVNLENKNDNWIIIAGDDTYGVLTYSSNAGTFSGTVVAQGLEANGKYQITLNGPGTCTTTDDNLATFGANLYEGGYWNNWAPNLASTCTGTPGEGIYNINLVSDHYTVIADGSGNINHAFNLSLPSGTYSGVKVLVKKMLDTHASPWVDNSVEHTTNLFEVAPINFIVL